MLIRTLVLSLLLPVAASAQSFAPAGWADHGWRLRSVDSESGTPYGAHWWGLPGPGPEARYAGGYAGQRVEIGRAHV